MSEQEILDRIEGIFAYDMGSHDSGIKDDAFKASLKTMPEIDRLLMMVLARLTVEGGYTIEDAIQFCDWVQDYHDGLGLEY